MLALLPPTKVWGSCRFEHDVKKFDNTGEETDDLISIGTVGLIKAIGTFKPDKGTRLATYAARCIENEMSLAVATGGWVGPPRPSRFLYTILIGP